MKSIDKLRRTITEIDMRGRTDENGVITVYMSKGERRTLENTADEIEAEIADNYLEAPVDADGVPIRVGDMLMWADSGPFEVCGINKDSVWFDGSDKEWVAAWANVCHHVKPRTLEDVLKAFFHDALDADAFCTVRLDDVLAKYADEIREHFKPKEGGDD